MTSERQIAANRQNARRSTGPRTPRGKAAASKSALRHGLAANVLADPRLAQKIRLLALAIAGEGADPGTSEQAATIAQAQVVLERVRQARVALIDRPPSRGSRGRRRPDDSFQATIDQLRKLERYEQRAVARRDRAIRAVGAYG
jgi:hypothetical protein